MAINWGLAQQPNAFERAFSQSQQSTMQQRAIQREEEARNALASYAMKPNEAGFNALAMAAPEMAMQVQRQRQQAQQQATADRREQLPVIGRLLSQATPENWAQTIATAQQYGFDVSDVPQQFDPAWRENTVALVNAMQDPETQQRLPSIVQELNAAGIDHETPEGQRVLRQVIEGRYATEYTDPQGNVRRQRLFDLPDGGQQAQPVSRAVGGQTYYQNPQTGQWFDNAAEAMGGGQQMNAPTRANTPAPALGPNGLPSVLTRQQYEALVNDSGGNRAAVNDYLTRMGIQVRDN